MEGFRKVEPEEFSDNSFRIIGKDWMLITAEKDGKVNSMTAAWGGLGVMWGENAAFAVIRESRYTKEFVDSADSFSLTFFDPAQHREMLGYMGKVSGRDADKAKECGLNIVHHEGVPYYQEARTAIFCKKQYCQKLEAECFTVPELDEKWYADKDYHYLYIGKITDILGK